MKLFEKLRFPAFPGSGKKGEPERQDDLSRRRETDESARGALFEEDIVRMVDEEAKKRRLLRMPYELQWQLNENFLLGNQHCDVNVHRQSVENYKPLYDYMSQEVFNRIEPIMAARRSHLMQVSFDVTVQPQTDDYADIQKARVATALLQNRRRSEEYKEAFQRAVGICEELGSAFFLSWWDEKGACGEELAFTVLSPFEIFPENLYEESLEKQPSILIEQVKSLRELKDLYGVELQGDTDGYGLLRAPGAGGFGYEASTVAFSHCRHADSAVLRTYMEKPTGTRPKGRLILTAGGQLLFDGDLPYDGYPLCQMKSERVSGQFFGKSVIEALIPLQRSYNGIKNRINDFINRSTCGQLLVEEGSVDADDLTEKGLVPGEPVLYRRGAALPKLLEEPQLSGMALEQCEQLSQDMEYAAGVSGLLAGGKLPGGVISGSALERLQSIDAGRLSIYAENMRTGIRLLSKVWLSIYRRYLKGERTLLLTGENERGALMSFTASDLNSDDLVFENENELKVNEEEQRARYIETIHLGLFGGEDGTMSRRAREMARKRLLGKNGAPESEDELQMKNARRENAAFERGESPLVLPLDDHGLHLAEHRLYALQGRFRSLLRSDPARCEAMMAHICEHEALYAAERTKEKGETKNG